MTGTAYVVEAGRRHVTVDTGEFPHVGRVADTLVSHWAASFASYRSTSASSYATSLRDLLTYLNALTGPPEDLRFVDEMLLDGWVDDMRSRVSRGTTRGRATSVRVLLDNTDATDLHESLTDGKVLRWRPDIERGGVPLTDLTAGQWAALRKLAKRGVLGAARRIRAARGVAALGCDPGDELAGWLVQENVYWLVLNNRLDLDRFEAALEGAGWPAWLEPFRRASRVGRPPVRRAADLIGEQLLPTLLDMAAFWTAMAATTGLPPESVNELECHWFDTAPGGALTILRYRKQRRGTVTVPLVLAARPQFSAQRLRDLYMEMSAPLRTRADPALADRLWLFHVTERAYGQRIRTIDDTTRHFPKWVHASGLLDPAHIASVEEARAYRIAQARSSQPTPSVRSAAGRLRALEAWTGPIDPRRIRKTDKAHRLVMFGLGAAANDHTVRVLIAHTNSDLVRVRSALVITDVADSLTAFSAGPRPTTIVTADAAAEVETNGTAREQLAAMLEITGEQLDAVLAGRHTIGAVACIDPLASPHDEAGRFCRQAGSDLCLTCPQAIILAEHVPALWADVERLDRIAATMPGDSFAALHGDYHRILLDALAVFDPAGVAGYRSRGIIPLGTGGDPAPARLRRRRVSR